MRTIKLQERKVKDIVDVLRKGGLVIMPTETVYGAMVDATNQIAVNKLVAYKNRPFGKPFSVAVINKQMAKKYVNLNDTAEKLYNKYLPGPVTVVSTGKHKVANGVESELGTLGVRIPDYKMVLDVVKMFGKPVTATSANASYKKRPYSVEDILNNLSSKQKSLIDLIVDAGTLPRNEPSTVIDTTPDDPIVLRQGDVLLKDKIEVVSKSEENTQNIAKELWQKHEEFAGKRAIVFALQGELGVGKTVFTKGLAKAVGITEVIDSPTYTIESEYIIPKLHKKLLHVDTWRMKDDKELLSLDFEKNITDHNVFAIEWADKVADIVREFEEHAVVVWVQLSYGNTENERIVTWAAL